MNIKKESENKEVSKLKSQIGYLSKCKMQSFTEIELIIIYF